MQTNLAETVLDNGNISVEEQIDKLSAGDLLSDEVITKIFEQPGESS